MAPREAGVELAQLELPPALAAGSLTLTQLDPRLAPAAKPLTTELGLVFGLALAASGREP